MPDWMKAVTGVILITFAFCSTIYIYMQNLKSLDTSQQCRSSVAAVRNTATWELPYYTCIKEFPEGSEPYKRELQTYESNKKLMEWFGIILGLLGFVFLIPVAIKTSWRFLLNRVAELSAAIRGKQ